jgi:glycosyltransferase involved in cell wall biosynthesis
LERVDIFCILSELQTLPTLEIDFYQDYKNLPVPELVKIARSPWDYLPEAVAAADRVLRERGISVEEIAAEEWNLAQKEMSDALAKRRFGDYFEWLWELLRVDRSKEPAEKWFGFFILLYSLYYVYDLYVCTQTVVFYFRCKICTEWRTPVFWDAGISIYSTICLYLVLKQKRLGWSMLCIQAIVMGCGRLLLFYRYYHHHFYIFDEITLLIPLLAYAVFLLFLFRPYILQVFRIDRKIRDRVLLIAAGLALVKVLFL